MVRPLRDGTVGRKPLDAIDVRASIDERCGYQGRVNINPRQVDVPALGRRIDLVTARKTRVCPHRFVPAVPIDEPRRLVGRMGGDGVEDILGMTGIREVESHQPQTRAGRMNVRVDETGREKGTLEIHHLVSDICVNAGPRIVTHPGDHSLVDHHSGREWVRRRVDLGVHQQCAAGRTHAGIRIKSRLRVLRLRAPSSVHTTMSSIRAPKRPGT